MEWKKVKWPYNHKSPYSEWECWKYGKVILYPGLWPTEGWSYVRTGAANSDFAHSGFLPGFITIASAKAEIERRLRTGELK